MRARLLSPVMGRPRQRPPLIVQGDIDFLVSFQKHILNADWKSRIIGSKEGSDIRGSLNIGNLPIGAPIRGTLHIYSRQNLKARQDDWSTGLVFIDPNGNSYRVIRCNGPHGTPHTNHIEGDKILGHTHIHRLTERYQRSKRYAIDGYAEITHRYSDINQAINTLVDLANISTPPLQGTL